MGGLAQQVVRRPALEAFAANISTSGTFTIKPGARVEASECCAAPDKFTDSGTLTVPASAGGIAELDWLSFQDQGSVSVSAGSTLHVTVGPGAFSNGASISGGGTMEFDQSAQMTLASNITIAAGTTLALTGEATFKGPGTFAGQGKFAWTGGTIAAGDPDQRRDDEAGVGHDHRRLDLLRGPDHFANTGTLQVAAGAGTATVTDMTFGNSGTVKLASGTLAVPTLSYHQTAGTTQLAGGTLTAAQPVIISGGKLTGFGTITGSVSNAGTVSPSTTGGVLKITGNYAQTGSGALSTVVTGTTPGKRLGQLDVGGTATLAGTLRAVTGNGFKPKRGGTFTVLVCHARGGKFRVASGSPAYSAVYGGTSVKIKYH